MAGSPEHAYATVSFSYTISTITDTKQLLMTDSYLPGAMVLGHSLKDGGTSKQLIALITPETISASTIDELKVCLHPFLVPFSRFVECLRSGHTNCTGQE